ncbi:unnamed protein product [Adineta steineri]|uniref:Uncharacterized protein n=1 Tax=Adineta steineri TaxID=433720 RepID=A0A813Z607_9BILA|nr:unnamed protein product [Adineta steineri]
MTTSTTTATSTSTVLTCQLTFGPTDLYATDGFLSSQLAADDFNGDGLSDLALCDSWNSAVDVFLGNGNGNGTFGQEMTYPVVDGGSPISLDIADFNNDNHLDIVVMNDYTYSVGILFGNGNGTFGVMIILPVVFSVVLSQPLYFRCIATDLNNDGYIDIVFTKNNYPCSIAILLGFGNGSFATETIISIGSDGCELSFAIADFNDDDNKDVAVAIDIDFYVAVLLGRGNGSFKTPMTFSTGIYSFPSSIDVNDFNNDGYLDIVVANQGNYNIGVFFGMGDGTFGTQITTMTEHTNIVTRIAVGDFNSDGKMDIAGVCGVENTGLLSSIPTFVTVFVGYGNGNFGQQMIFPTEPDTLKYVITNDFNGDGLLDLAITYQDGMNVGILLNTCPCCALEISSQAYLSTNDSP